MRWTYGLYNSLVLGDAVARKRALPVKGDLREHQLHSLLSMHSIVVASSGAFVLRYLARAVYPVDLSITFVGNFPVAARRLLLLRTRFPPLWRGHTPLSLAGALVYAWVIRPPRFKTKLVFIFRSPGV